MTAVALLWLSAWVQDRASLDAFTGEPFGAALLVVPLGDKGYVHRPDLGRPKIGGRALYPVVLLDGDLPASDATTTAKRTVEVLFLFRGDARLEVRLDLPDGRSFSAAADPRARVIADEDLQNMWWKSFVARADNDASADVAPTDLDSYLVAMLAERLSHGVPELGHNNYGLDDYERVFGLLLGVESVRAAMARDVFLEKTRREEAPTRPFPKAAAPPALEIPAVPDDVKVEPIALHVPAECFYVRFGSFSNFMWLRKTIDRWGGDARDLVSVRALDQGIREKLEKQLALRETVLSTFGDLVVSDVALIGADTFVREGAALGLLFEARDNRVLAEALRRLRAEDKEAKETTVRIANHDVSLVSTPDNRVRSFYAVDGDYHLVTTSREIVRRFYQAGADVECLGNLKEFRYARHLMPLKRGDAAFLFLSDPFYRNIVGPRYRVEMTRRLQALVEIELVQMARLAARGEGFAPSTMQELIDGKFLPKAIETRPDGSRPVLKDGRVTDSLRGARGTFLPIPDVEFEKITDSEERAYNKFDAFYSGEWERVDPVMIGIQRLKGSADDRERVSMDIHISPYAKSHYRWRTSLDAPTREALPDSKHDVATIVVNTVRPSLLCALRDFDPWILIENGEIEPDWTEFFENMTYPNESDLKNVERPAQIRLRIGELAGAKLARLAHAAGYLQARKASAGNVRFAHGLIDQLGVAPDEAMKATAEILGATPVCPLGGKYAVKDGAWTSSAWTAKSLYDLSEAPADYRFPLVEWLREFRLEFSIDETTITVHAELEVKK